MDSKPSFHRSRSVNTDNNDDNHEDSGLNTSLLSDEEKPKRRIHSWSHVFLCSPRWTKTVPYLHRRYHDLSSRLHTMNPSYVLLLKKALAITAFILVVIISKRYIHISSFFTSFLAWMQQNPRLGIAVYVLVYASHLVLLFPGTPFVLGAGYVYKTTYGWTLGIILCSLLSLFGSLIGSVGAFLLGRYCIKEWVRSRWNGAETSGSKKTLYLQALDSAISENGFKIMVMLYLTPITPLGPLSYLIGTTNMKLSSFAKAKIAALPLTMMYVFLGASTGTLFLSHPLERSTVSLDNLAIIPGNENTTMMGIDSIVGNKSMENVAPLDTMEDIPISSRLIILGIIFSIMSITFISVRVKREIDQILEKQSKLKEDVDSESQRLGLSTVAIDQGSTRLRRH